MLVLLLLVLALHHYAPVGRFDGDLLRRELLHIEDDLEPVLVEVERRAGILPREGGVAPRTVVATAQQRWRGERGTGREGGEQIIRTDGFGEGNSTLIHRKIHIDVGAFAQPLLTADRCQSADRAAGRNGAECRNPPTSHGTASARQTSLEEHSTRTIRK